jgi:hypothetical protein
MTADTINAPAPITPTETRPAPGYLGLLDGILRRREDFFGEIFRSENLRERIRAYLVITAILSLFYGVTMGTSSFVVGVDRGLLQMLSSGLKVPALYLLTILICFPVLFVVLVLMGSRLSFAQTLALILLALALNSILLAAFAPIILFFIITGSSYEFVKLLHVAIMGFSGLWAMAALWHGLREMCETSDLYPKQAVRILQIWILVFGFVGTQMAWSLRPFVGNPGRPFQVLRADQEGNFYGAVAHSIAKLFSHVRD